MGRVGRWEYLRGVYDRYRKATKAAKGRILDEFCAVAGYHRKYATRVLNGPRPEARRPRRERRGRKPRYGPRVVSVLVAIWEAAGYPWSVRLKALLPTWRVWVKKRFALSAATERQLLSISARQIDRRLAGHKRQAKRRLYGRTKPGTLLKHHIPIKTDHWDVSGPGFAEIDLVSHSGNNASGEFVHTLNLTDIHTTWVESRAVMGKSQAHVCAALDAIRSALPFRLKAIDSDNGSEFINAHLFGYCQAQAIEFTRGRAYQKDDNAHIEQKNWTHVRKLLGWERYDSERAQAALNALYCGDLRLFQNLFLPSVKLREKKRVGSRLVRRYDAPLTPLERVASCAESDAESVARFLALRARVDPFALSSSVDRQLERVYALANRRQAPKATCAAVMEAAAPDGKATDAPTNARPPALPQGLGKRCAFRTAPTAQTDDQSRNKTEKATAAPPTPGRAKPVDGPSKHTRLTPPTGFRRRSRKPRPATKPPASAKPPRVTFLMSRRSPRKLHSQMA